MGLMRALFLSLSAASPAVIATLGICAWCRRDVPGARTYAGPCFVIEIWLLANLARMVDSGLGTMLVTEQIKHSAYSWVPLGCVVWALQTTGRSSWLIRLRLAALAVEPIIATALAWTNPVHGWLWSTVYFTHNGASLEIGKTFGSWLWIHACYSYLLFVVALGLLVSAEPHSLHLNRGQLVMLSGSLLLPLAWHTWYTFGLGQSSDNDLAPLIYCLAGLLTGWGLFRFRLFDLVPVARNMVIERLDNGVIVPDAQGSV
jgi:hypothetical protein